MNETVNLRDYLEARITHVEQLAGVRIDAADRAVRLASDALAIRLEGMNEIRSQLTDQAAKFVTREAFEALSARVQDLRESRSDLLGRRAGIAVAVGVVGAVVGFLIALLAYR